MPSRSPTSDRERLGAYYTPPALVDFLVREVVVPACRGRREPPTVVDPACGDGRLLDAAGRVIAEQFGVDPRPFLHGVEVDPGTARSTAQRSGIEVAVRDARRMRRPPGGRPADVVIGNPPYLSQLSAATARGGRSALGGGPYADVAAEFLALALGWARPDGGRIGLVLPLSILATRDVGPIRRAVDDAARLDVCWWSDEAMFDAQVRTCILGFVTRTVRGAEEAAPVRRFAGSSFAAVAPAVPPAASAGHSWSWLVADVGGVPRLDAALESAARGRLGDIASATADFRDQYYGLVDAVHDAATGPPLVTSGLIEPARCLWGERPVRFAKRRHAAPRVDLDRLSPPVRAWAASRLVPKVLVATQTKVIEAVVDERGEWLPSVPVVSVVPRDPEDLWRVAAVLTSPVASAWLAARRFGSGLSVGTIRVMASDLALVPLPSRAGPWSVATRRLRSGDVTGCGRAMLDAYGLADRTDLFGWWDGLSGPRAGRG